MNDKNHKLTEREQRSYAFLKCVFPDEVTEEDKFIFIRVLHDEGEISFRAIAAITAVLMGHSEADYLMYLHDTYGVEQRQVDAVKAQQVHERLYTCGFAEWIEE